MIAMEDAQTFINTKLADTLRYKDGARDYLKRLTNTALDRPLQALGITEMTNAAQMKMPITKENNTIAVYYATGDITDNAMAAIPGSYGGIDGNTVVKDLNRLREDTHVKAVVLRVNSPGGSAFASEQIWHEIMKLKA